MKLTNDAQTREIEELKQEIVSLRKEISHLSVECLRYQDIANRTVQQEHLQLEFSTSENQINSDFSEERNPLKAENEMLKLIIDKMNVGVFITDNNGNPLFFNKGALQIHGIESEEEMMALYSRFDKEFELLNSEGTIIPVEDWPNSKALRNDFVKDFEVKLLVRKNGITKDISISTVPVYNDLNELSLIVYNLTDLSEIEKVNEVLFLDKNKKSDIEQIISNEERLRVAIESAELGTWDFDIETGVAVHSARHDQIFGYQAPQHEWSYEISVKHILPEFHPVVREAVARAIDTGYLSYEAKITWPDGSEHWIAPKGRVHYSKEGKPLRMAGIVEDITRQKKTEESLLYERELLEGIFNNIPILITIYEPSLKNFRFNPRFKEVLGWTEEDAASGDFIEKVYPDPEYRKEVTRFMQSLESGWKEFEATAKDGTKVIGLWANILLKSGVQIGIGIDMRERKKSDLKLRDSEQRLQAIFNNAAIGIAEIDVGNRFIYVNQRLCEILGYTQEQLLSKTVMEITVPEDREHSQELYDKLRGGDLNILNYEKRYLKPDGSSLWVHVSVSAIRDQQGKLLKSIGTIKDISERKEVEKALRESEEKFRLLADNISQMVWIANHEGMPVWFNKRWYDFTGVSLEDMQHGGHTKTNHPDFSERVFQGFMNSINNNIPWEETYPMRDRDGGYRWFLSRSMPIFDEKGKTTLWFGTSTDITEQKLAEEEAQARATEIEAILRCIPDCLLVYNSEGNIVRSNPAAHEFLLHPESEQPLKFPERVTKYYKVWTEDERQLKPEEMPSFRSSVYAETVKNEVLRLERNNQSRWFIFNAAPLVISGKHAGSVLSMVDISPRKQVEHMLRESEERFRLLADHISQIAWITNENGEPLWYNKKWVDYTGLTLEDVQANGYKAVLHPDYADQVLEAFNNSLKNGQPWESTYPMLGKDGNYRWFLSRALPIHNNNHKISLWFGTNTDITEQRKVEDALREGEQRLAAIFNNAAIGIVEVSNENRFIMVNDRICNILGYSREELLQKTVLEITADEDKNLSSSYFRKLDTGELDILNYEKRYLKKDGSPLWVHVSVSVIRDEHGNHIKSIGTIEDISVRRSAEESLRLSEEKLKAIFENLTEGLITVDPKGGLLEWNPAALSMHGYVEHNSKLEFLSKALENFEPTTINNTLLPYDDLPINRIMRGEDFKDYPLYIRNKEQGWQKLISYSGKLIHDSNGQPFMGFLSLRDISEMQKAQDALRKSREELKSITDNSPDVIARFDTQLRHTFINPYGEQVYGKTHEEIIGKTNADLNMPESLVLFWKSHFEAVFASGQSRNIEFEFDSPTFGKQFFLSVFVPEKNEKSDIVSVLAITREITGIKRSEQKLRESEEMFSTMFHAMPVGVSLSTPSGELYNVNKAWLELSGHVDKDEVIGKTLMELGIVANPQIRNQVMEEFEKNGIVRNAEASYITKTGVERVVYINIDPVQIWGQKFLLSAIEDITDQKRIEMEIQQKNEELTRFIYTVSHDLKSPLVTIKSFSSFLISDIESNDKEALDRDIMYIQNAADKMGKLLDELLELSRIGRKEVTKTEVPMQEIAQAAIDLVAGQINKRKVNIRFVGKPVMLYGHTQRLIQLYQNLIDNAVKFMGKQSEPLIEIGTLIERDKILLFIRDNGIGIDPRYHHKLFGLFEKLDNSIEGTGIGLALIKRIVEVHGGSIWFVSEGSGKGTTFYFTLDKTRIIKNE